MIEDLTALKTRSGAGAARRKTSLISRASRDPFADPRLLLAYHELLLFFLAYPDNAEVHRLAGAELRRVARIARDLCRHGPRRDARRLDDSGVAHSSTTSSFTADAALWLADRFPRSVELVWDDEGNAPSLDALLPALVTPVEGDGLRHSGCSTRDWVERARGRRGPSDLRWLLDRLTEAAGSGPLRDRVFESLDLQVRWRLSTPVASRTFQRFPTRRRPFLHVDGLVRPSLDEPVDAPLPPVRPLPVAEARRFIDVGRAALCVRHRETEAVTYANPREVLRVSLDRGLDIVLYGMRPDRRLPIESFFGYLAVKNGLPVGYGGGWIFLDRCEIGINIFDTFRGGESAYVFGQTLRVYRGLFDVHRFTIDPFQFGADNREGIASGAFWFYYRFGFRPIDPAARDLAAREWARIGAERGYRSPARVLRRFARGKLELTLEPRGRRPATPAPDPELESIGLAVTSWIGAQFGGDGTAATRFARRRLARSLRIADEEVPDEPHTMSLLAAMIPDLARWPAADRASLLALLRAKGGPQEREYVRRLRRHGRFRGALAALGART